MTGFFKMRRGWQNSKVFGEVEFSERDAWAWIIERAVHKETTVNSRGKPVKLKRGQLCYAIRYLAEAWGWKRGKSERFINKLKKWDMIETQAETGILIITISNYAKYQDKRDDAETQAEQKSGQQRDKAETNKKKDKEVKKKKEGGEIFLLPGWIARKAWDDYEDMRNKIKKPMTDAARSQAVQTLEKLRQRNHDPGEVLAQSVFNSWQGLFEIKAKNNEIASRAIQKSSKSDLAKAAIARSFGFDSPEERSGSPEAVSSVPVAML